MIGWHNSDTVHTSSYIRSFLLGSIPHCNCPLPNICIPAWVLKPFGALPSVKLAYFLPRHFWRWFSFSNDMLVPWRVSFLKTLAKTSNLSLSTLCLEFLSIFWTIKLHERVDLIFTSGTLLDFSVLIFWNTHVNGYCDHHQHLTARRKVDSGTYFNLWDHGLVQGVCEAPETVSQRDAVKQAYLSSHKHPVQWKMAEKVVKGNWAMQKQLVELFRVYKGLYPLVMWGLY